MRRIVIAVALPLIAAPALFAACSLDQPQRAVAPADQTENVGDTCYSNGASCPLYRGDGYAPSICCFPPGDVESGICRDLTNDPDNCGACNNDACHGDATCNDGCCLAHGTGNDTCSYQSSSDATITVPASGFASSVVSASTYGGTGCSDHFVVDMTGTSNKWTHITATSDSYQASACDCDNFVIEMDLEAATSDVTCSSGATGSTPTLLHRVRVPRSDRRRDPHTGMVGVGCRYGKLPPGGNANCDP